MIDQLLLKDQSAALGVDGNIRAGLSRGRTNITQPTGGSVALCAYKKGRRHPSDHPPTVTQPLCLISIYRILYHISSMGFKLLSFPAEIIQNILSTLSRPDVGSVCLVSRRCQEFAEAQLYHTIDNTWTKAEDSNFILLLLRSILSNPRRHRYIKDLRLLESESFSNRCQDLIRLYPDEDVLRLGSRIIRASGISVKHQEFWIQGLVHGDEDAFLALLLSQLSEIRRLTLGYRFWRNLAYTGKMLRASICKESAYPLSKFVNLEYVSCEDYLHIREYIRSRNTMDLLPLFYLRNVKEIMAVIDNPPLLDVSVWVCCYKPNPQTLTSLHLMNVREDFLAEILSATKALKYLRWEWYYHECGNHSYNPVHDSGMIDLDQLAAAVMQVRSTLFELRIECWRHQEPYDLEQPEIQIEGSLKSLASFEKLQILKAPLPFLVGGTLDRTMRFGLDEIVPQNLQNLRISDDVSIEFEWYEGDVAEIIIESWLKKADWKKSAPNLTVLTLVTRDEDIFTGKTCNWSTDIKQRHAIAKLCAQEGIGFEWVYEG